MKQIYSKDEFKMYQSADDGFIVHNTKKDFEDGHTHLKSFNQAKYLIDMVRWKRVPHHLSEYLLRSLIRISDDEKYQLEVLELLESKKAKDKQSHVNCRC